MYEVGSWFVILMNGAILAILGAVALVAIYVKRAQYQKEAEKSIQAEIIQPSGHSKFYTVRCGQDAKSVDIGGGTYYFDFPATDTSVPDQKKKVDPLSPESSEEEDNVEKPGNERRWGKHPVLPFMGLATLQVPIRKETWYLGNPLPQRLGPAPSTAYTALEIAAMKRGAISSAGTVKLAENEARQKQLQATIANQPNKNYVYAGLAGIFIAVIVSIVIMVQTSL